MTSIGFHVWNPAGRLPTVTHQTFLAAWAEKDRLQRLHPTERFVVMMPCEDVSAIGYGLGFTRGREEAKRDIDARVRDAWQVADIARADATELRKRLAAAEPLIRDVEAYQAIVADCLLWFQGFNAAYAGCESYDRPNTPSVDKLRDLNIALQFILRERDKASGSYRDLDDQEIPF